MKFDDMDCLDRHLGKIVLGGGIVGLIVFLIVCGGLPAALIYFLVQWANWLAR